MNLIVDEILVDFISLYPLLIFIRWIISFARRR